MRLIDSAKALFSSKLPENFRQGEIIQGIPVSEFLSALVSKSGDSDADHIAQGPEVISNYTQKRADNLWVENARVNVKIVSIGRRGVMVVPMTEDSDIEAESDLVRGKVREMLKNKQFLLPERTFKTTGISRPMRR